MWKAEIAWTCSLNVTWNICRDSVDILSFIGFCFTPLRWLMLDEREMTKGNREEAPWNVLKWFLVFFFLFFFCCTLQVTFLENYSARECSLALVTIVAASIRCSRLHSIADKLFTLLQFIENLLEKKTNCRRRESVDGEEKQHRDERQYSHDQDGNVWNIETSHKSTCHLTIAEKKTQSESCKTSLSSASQTCKRQHVVRMRISRVFKKINLLVKY